MGAKQSLCLAGPLLAIVALGGIWSVDAAGDKSYPNRLVKLVIPIVPGGPTDIVGRVIADKLSVGLKQPFVIENRTGAGGNIGTDIIAKSPPDGYTLGFVLSTMLTVNPSLYKKFPFDPDKDVRPISLLTGSGMMLVVHPSVPVNSVAEFVAYAKAAAARKEPIAYASGGNGTPGHLTMENFRLHAGFEAVHVPYRGNTPLVIDLVAGQIKFAFVTSSGMMDHVLAGRLRALGVSRLTRSPLAPDVPTISESGYPGFRVESYNVFLAPAGIPDPIAALLERESLAALTHPDIIERARAMDLAPLRIGAMEARAQIKADREAWAKVVAATGMRLD
jgi:tripartite-type tricarboxylate transporter receptor subunit TctC